MLAEAWHRRVAAANLAVLPKCMWNLGYPEPGNRIASEMRQCGRRKRREWAKSCRLVLHFDNCPRPFQAGRCPSLASREFHDRNVDAGRGFPARRLLEPRPALVGRDRENGLIGFRSAVGRQSGKTSRRHGAVRRLWKRSSDLRYPQASGRPDPHGNPQASPGAPEWPDAHGLKPVRSRRGFASRDAVRRPRKGAAR